MPFTKDEKEEIRKIIRKELELFKLHQELKDFPIEFDLKEIPNDDSILVKDWVQKLIEPDGPGIHTRLDNIIKEHKELANMQLKDVQKNDIIKYPKSGETTWKNFVELRGY